MSYIRYKIDYLDSPKVYFSLPVNLAPQSLFTTDDFSCTILARDSMTDKNVYIKKIMGHSAYESYEGKTKLVKKGVFTDQKETFRLLLEIKILKYLQQFHHPNMLSMFAMIPPENSNFENFRDIYLVYENFGVRGLQNLSIDNRSLTPLHVKSIILQILRGVSFLNSCGIYGQDLSPKNIFVDEKTQVKLCDFSLVERSQSWWIDDSSVNSYQSPEMLLGAEQFDGSKSDIWSIGVILLQLICGNNIFQGNTRDQILTNICMLVGNLSKDDFPEKIINTTMERRLLMLEEIRLKQSKSIGDILSGYIPDDYVVEKDLIIDLLTRIFIRNPDSRISPVDALKHPYFRNDHRLLELFPEPPLPLYITKFKFDFVQYTSLELKSLIYEEIRQYFPDIGNIVEHK